MAWHWGYHSHWTTAMVFRLDLTNRSNVVRSIASVEAKEVISVVILSYQT